MGCAGSKCYETRVRLATGPFKILKLMNKSKTNKSKKSLEKEHEIQKALGTLSEYGVYIHITPTTRIKRELEGYCFKVWIVDAYSPEDAKRQMRKDHPELKGIRLEVMNYPVWL